MPLSRIQIINLLESSAAAEPDELDCDGCFDHLAEFAEARLAEAEIPAALKAVETHLEQCVCCRDEFAALLEGLRAIEEDELLVNRPR